MSTYKGSLLFFSIFILLSGPFVETAQEGMTLSDNPLVGTWKLVSIKATSGRGEIKYFYGENPFGRLFYTRGGHMSALLMDPDRPTFKADDLAKGTVEEIRAAFSGFDAYCGTYTVNPVKNTVTHHVQASKYPNWVGSDQVRFFEIHGGRLRLTATIPAQGVEWFFEAIWFKM